MELPINTKISIVNEQNEKSYHIPLLNRRNSILRYIGGILLFSLFFFSTANQVDFSLKIKVIIFSFYAVITLLDAIVILWMIYGKEIVRISDEYLEICNVCHGIVFRRKYMLEQIKDIRINIKYKPIHNMKVRISNIPELLGYNRGFVVFKYKDGNVEFGTSLNVEEAHYFVEGISKLITK
jgi:hypothetical protein